MIELNKKELKLKQKFNRILKDNDAFYQYRQRFLTDHKKIFNMFIKDIRVKEHRNYDYTYNNFIKLAHGDYNFLINLPFEWFTTDDFDMWNKISKLIKYTAGKKAFKNFLKRSDEYFYNGQ